MYWSIFHATVIKFEKTSVIQYSKWIQKRELIGKKKVKPTFTRFVLASRCCRCSSCLAFWSSCLRRLASSSFSFFSLSSSSFLCWISSDVGLWATGLPGKKLFKFPSKFEGALAGDARTRDLNLQYIRITNNLIRLVLQICFSFFVPHGLEFHVMHSNSKVQFVRLVSKELNPFECALLFPECKNTQILYNSVLKFID